VTWDGTTRNYVGIAAELKVGTTTTFTTPTWAADITDYVRDWSTNRGTQRELQRVEAGTATITLDNRSGRFTPQSTTSPYYPNLLPMRRIRIRATWNSVTYPIFQGFVEAWPASFPAGIDQIVSVSAVDGFKVLSLASVSGSVSQQVSGARVTAILDAIGWPAADRTIAAGLSTVPAITLTNVSALEHLQAIEHAEGGRLFMGRDGKVNFVDRTPSSPPDFSGRTWTDDGSGVMSYRDITLAFTDELLINEARLTRIGGAEQVASSAASITTYFRRSLIEGDIQLVTDNAVSDLAVTLVGQYSEPALRIEGLADNAMGHGLWGQVLTRELRDRVLIVKTPVGSSTLSQDSYIEGISHDAPSGEWRTSLRVSPAAGGAAFWTWDTSQWDISTKWAR
jgi:hypothetical protein